MLSQNFTRALDNRGRQSGEASDFNAIAAVGLARSDSVEEDDAIACFFYTDAEIADAIELTGKFCQFVIVSGEECLCTGGGGNVFDHRPGEGQSVVGRRTAANFIENDEAVRGGGVQDDGSFGHFHHESGTAARKIIGGADAGEDAVDEGQGGGRGRHPGSPFAP